MFVNAKTNCTHVSNIKIIPITEFNPFEVDDNEMTTLLQCFICQDHNYIFICLTCQKKICYNHLNHHNKDSDNLHPIALCLDDLSIWCCQCITIPFMPNGSFIKSPLIYDHIQYIFEFKYDLPYFANYSKAEIYKRKYNNFIELLKKDHFQEIVLMVGAGISTTAGIPDFRSKTGLFQQLQDKYNLSSPEEFFMKQTFLDKPIYFYEFCKHFDLSKIEPTITHKFMSFLVHKNLVKYVFTQNIDGLELKAGIPRDKVVFAHGTFEDGHCPTCKCTIDIEIIKKGIENSEVILCPTCNGPCKPNIVFYGEQLSEDFFQKANSIRSSDLGIVMGTSLKVHPFAALPKLIQKKDSWRISINRSLIGNFKYDYLSMNSLFISGTTDDVVKQLLIDLNWQEEFNTFIESHQK